MVLLGPIFILYFWSAHWPEVAGIKPSENRLYSGMIGPASPPLKNKPRFFRPGLENSGAVSWLNNCAPKK